MHQLVYISKATRAFAPEELHQLCEVAATRNRRREVTGLLLFDGSRFIQALEGEQAAVREAMARIVRDDRHVDIDYVSDQPIAARQFGDWSMDYKTARAGCCSREFLETVKRDVDAVEDHALRAIFIGFAVLGSQGPIGYRCAAV